MTLLRFFRPSLCAASVFLGLLLLAGPSAAQPAESAPDSFRVAVATFSHETCTFCPGEDADLEAWMRYREPYSGQEVLREGGSYIEGFLDRAAEYGDVAPVGLTSPAGVWGGSSRSWITEKAFTHFLDRMLADLREKRPVDGVYLSLHGAMAVRNVPRPEAEIARQFREVVGPDVPIVATFDLHGNEDGRFLEWADGAFVTKRYPHYDTYRQGERAARYLRQVMRGAYTPTTASRKPPVVTATVLQWTGQSPSMDIMERARRWEAREDDAYVNVFYGFPWSDVPDVGTTVHVMTDGDQALADSIANDMADFIWRVREDFAHGDYPTPKPAVRRARKAIQAGETPVVLADYWDRPGDATWTLRELIEQDVGSILYASLTAKPTLDRIWEEGLEAGDAFEGTVGGYTGEQAGEPVSIDGTLAWRGEHWGYDRVAAIDFGDDSTIILVPAYQQTITPEELRFGPIEPNEYQVFVSKTRVHFRRGFDETGYAPTNIIVDAPGDWFGTTRLDALDYEHAPLDRLYPFGTPGSWHGRSLNPGVSAP
jgi:microcystin degradation protein MlrC